MLSDSLLGGFLLYLKNYKGIVIEIMYWPNKQKPKELQTFIWLPIAISKE